MIANEVDTIRQVISEVLVIDIDDGLSFDTTATSAESIREDDQYSGVRVHVSGRLASARLRFHVDVNIGDPITPSPTTVPIPRLLGGELYVAGYPIEMVLAEKIVTAVGADRSPRWGGWGYRVSLRLIGRAAWVLRRGRALRLDLDDGRTSAVTVDHASAVANEWLARPPSASSTSP